MNISIVVPVYNEAKAIHEFHKRLRLAIDGLPHSFEILYVNDGSTDETESEAIVLIRQDVRVRLINLSRNFGHEAALTAGLDFADGDVVITMDGDGQHPPRYIPDLLDIHAQGFDVVLAQRFADPGVGLVKRVTSKLFYWLINLLSQTEVVPGASDYRLLSRDAVQSFRQIRETNRFIRGLVTWMGYRWTILEIEHQPRIAGESKYSIRKLVKLAFGAIFAFSTVPIRLMIIMGLIVLGLAFLEFLDPLIQVIRGRDELLPGWTTLIVSVLVLGATQLMTLAIVGQYVGLVYEEVKGRPIYLLRGKPLDSEGLSGEGST